MASTYKAIATTTVGSGGAANITFSSIPQTYTDLVVLMSFRDSANTGNQATQLRIRFNGDTGNNYNYKVLEAFSGTGTQSYGASSTSFASGSTAPTSSTTSNVFSNSMIYVPNYTSSNIKSFSSDGVAEYNSSSLGVLDLVASNWTGTSAITSITCYCATGDLVQYSTATLYGIKNS